MPAVCRLQSAENVVDARYDLLAAQTPVARGRVLKLFLWFLRTPLGILVQAKLLRQNGVPQVLRETEFPEKPTFTPTPFFQPVVFPDHVQIEKRNDEDAVKQVLALLGKTPTHGSGPPTIRDYIDAYTSGRVTPLQVAKKIVAVIENSPDLYWFISFQKEEILDQGRASTERYAKKAPVSPLDGIPFCVKDMIHAQGHATTCGTQHLAQTVDEAHREAPVVGTMRKLGGMFLGKTNMNEIGLGVTGLNLRHGTAVNPWDQAIYTGGSSSGGAAVVAAGICPLSVGSDGGGSIRVPSSFCGVFGLKMTHGREIPQYGTAVDYTVCSYGPLANSAEDAMLLYTILAKSDPPLLLPKLSTAEKPLTGLKFGVYWEWFNDADYEVETKCHAVLELLRDLGGSIVSVSIPELEFMRVAHAITISSEMRQAMNLYATNKRIRSGMNLDVQLNLLLAERFKAQEYIHAQCIRTRMGVHFKRVMEEVDCLVTPTTPMTAPEIHPKARVAGEHNLAQTLKIMRFMAAPNFLGLPAMSVPIGLDSKARPIG